MYRLLNTLGLLMLLTASTQAQNLAAYLSGDTSLSKLRLNQILMLSDSTLLVGGESNTMSWVPNGVAPTVLDTSGTGLVARRPGFAFIIRFQKNFSQILNVVVFPENTATNVYRIRTTTPPGQATGDIYISGEREGYEGRFGGYFIARLNNNFVTGTPTGFRWIRNIRVGEVSSGKTDFDGKSWHKTRQPWDVDNQGRVTYAEREEFSFNFSNISRIDANGNREMVKHWQNHTVKYSFNGDSTYVDPYDTLVANRIKPCQTGSFFYVRPGDSIWVNMRYFRLSNRRNDSLVNRKVAAFRIFDSFIMMKHAGTGARVLKSTSQAAYDFVGTDENGNARRHAMPDDYMYSRPCVKLPDSTWDCGTANTPGPTGYTAPNGQFHTSRVGDIVIDKRNNNLYFAYTAVLYNSLFRYFNSDPTGFRFGTLDYNSTVVAMTDSGSIRWWARMYKDDTAGTGFTANQFADHLALDYSNNRLVVMGNGFGTSTSNFWKGNQVTASAGGNGYKNDVTPEHTNVYAWVGSYSLNNLQLLGATYISEYSQTPQRGISSANPLYDGWPEANSISNNESFGPTRGQGVFVDNAGGIYVLGRATRSMTTTNAFIKMYKADVDACRDSLGGGHHFIRKYTPNLSAVEYSSVLGAQWSPITGTNGDAVIVNHLLPYGNNILATGYHTGLNNTMDMPTVNVPSFGRSSYRGESGVFAQLKLNCPTPSPVAVSNIPIQVDSAVTTNISIGSMPGATGYSWFSNLRAVQLGNNLTTTPNNTLRLAGNILSFEMYVAARNACGVSPARGRVVYRTPTVRQSNATTLTVSLPGFTRFTWFRNGDSIATQTTAPLNFTNFGPGSYQVRATNDCGTVLSTIRDLFTAIPAKLNALNLSMYPNPNQGTLFIEGDKLHSNTRIRLVDGQGKIMQLVPQFNGRKAELSLEHLSPGLYQVLVENEAGASQAKIQVVK